MTPTFSLGDMFIGRYNRFLLNERSNVDATQKLVSVLASFGLLNDTYDHAGLVPTSAMN